MPVMEMRNLNWFQLEVTDHICHTEKDWGQFLHPSLNNTMFRLVLDTFSDGQLDGQSASGELIIVLAQTWLSWS